jgi:hypothetical protein
MSKSIKPQLRPLRIINMGTFPIMKHLVAVGNTDLALSVRVRQFEDQSGRVVTVYNDWNLMKQCFNPCKYSILSNGAPCKSCPPSDARFVGCEHFSCDLATNNDKQQCPDCYTYFTGIFGGNAHYYFPFCRASCQRGTVPERMSPCNECDECQIEAENPAIAVIECDMTDIGSVRRCGEYITFLRRCLVYVGVVIVVCGYGAVHMERIKSYFCDNQRYPHVRVTCVLRDKSLHLIRHIDWNLQARVADGGTADTYEVQSCVLESRDGFVRTEDICPTMDRRRVRRALLRCDTLNLLKYSHARDGCYMTVAHFIEKYEKVLEADPVLKHGPHVDFLLNL